MTQDYIVQVKIRNGPLLRLMRGRGLKNVAELSRACGIHQTTLFPYLNLKRAPMSKNGRWNPIAERLATFFKVMPEDLFPPQHYTNKLDKNHAEFEVSLDQIDRFIDNLSPEKLLMQDDDKAILERALETIQPRHRQALEAVYLDGRTLEDVANEMGVSRSRVNQMCGMALRRLKHPSHGLGGLLEDYKEDNK